MTTATVSYRLLEGEEIPRYLIERELVPHPMPSAAGLRSAEVSDGNLNRVFIVRNDDDVPGIVLKQALPWVRVHGEGWPLSPERAAREAHAYEIYSGFAGELLPRFFGFDRDRYILAMEDLGHLRVWREALNAGDAGDGVARAIGFFVARIGFHTSDLGIAPEERKLLAARSVNPDLCRITEDVVLREPYIAHEHNHNIPELDLLAHELRCDDVLAAEVAVLKHAFMTKSEALIHGDLHSGSIMVGGGRTVVIDPEFCFYGPLGFDLGVFWGNCMMAAVRAAVLSAPVEFTSTVRELIGVSWVAFREEISRLWRETVDDSFGSGFRLRYLRSVWADGLGYAGTEAMRRVIGYAHASDVDTLPQPQQAAAAAAVARISRRLIIERFDLSGSDDVLAAIDDEVAWALAEFAT